jgi:hypothetical protein
MTDTDRVDRYIVLVERLARLEHEMKLLQGEIQTVMEEMTEAEGRQAAEKLRHGHEAMVEALERHTERRHSLPIE